MPVVSGTGSFTAGSGLELFYRSWTIPQPATTLVLVHGGGEHSGRYAETAARLASDGCATYAFDLVGHGRSPGVRGHIDRFEDYVQAVARFVVFVSQRAAGRPPVLFGHSLGGLISTFYAVAHQRALSGLVLSAPFWQMRVVVPWWKDAVARLVEPIWPSLIMNRPRIGGEVLSHDPQKVAEHAADPLNHHKASARFYLELRRRFALVPSVLPQLTLPVLVVAAGDDQVASVETTRRLFPSIGSEQKRLIVYEGMFHELVNEVDRTRVWDDLAAWLRQHRDSGCQAIEGTDKQAPAR